MYKPVGKLVSYVFFFSSRRRHTRFKCDWSSDVCSSDLILFVGRRVMDLRPIDSSSMYTSVASLVAAEAAHAYESGGPMEFAHFANRLAAGHKAQVFLLDEFNKDVLSQAISNDALRLASQTGKDQLVTKYVPLFERIAAYKFVSRSG